MLKRPDARTMDRQSRLLSRLPSAVPAPSSRSRARNCATIRPQADPGGRRLAATMDQSRSSDDRTGAKRDGSTAWSANACGVNDGPQLRSQLATARSTDRGTRMSLELYSPISLPAWWSCWCRATPIIANGHRHPRSRQRRTHTGLATIAVVNGLNHRRWRQGAARRVQPICSGFGWMIRFGQCRKRWIICARLQGARRAVQSEDAPVLFPQFIGPARPHACRSPSWASPWSAPPYPTAPMPFAAGQPCLRRRRACGCCRGLGRGGGFLIGGGVWPAVSRTRADIAINCMPSSSCRLRLRLAGSRPN